MQAIYEESHKELKEFIEWFNRIYGLHPIIIGGWAVYHYNPYFGSKDIDVAFEFPRRAWDTQLFSYFAAHGYKLLNKNKNELTNDSVSPQLVQTFRKQINGEYIDLDACSTSDANLFHNPAYKHKQVPYSLAAKESNTTMLSGTKAIYRIPKIEVLLLYKLKAYNDRDWRIAHAISRQEAEYLTAKRNKDGSDIIALLDEENSVEKIDFNKLSRLVRAMGLRKMVVETLQQALNNASSASNYGKLSPHAIAAMLIGILSEITNRKK